MKPRFDPNNGNVYETNFDSGSVSVVSTVLTPTQGIQQLINTIDSFHHHQLKEYSNLSIQ
jgi:DNA-binding beta-propeller fold protein YncE